MRILLVAFLGFFVVVLAASTVCAQDSRSQESLDRQSYELYQQVFSPFCAGRSLNDCPSSKAHDLKLEMRLKLEQGIAPEQILEEVFQKFGDQYRAVPQYSGFGKLVWWAPITFLSLGAFVALLVARGRRSSMVSHSTVGERMPSKEAAKPTAINEDLRRRIERELTHLD